MTALELQKVYSRRGNFLLHDINFQIEEGEIVALSGRSGSGKSTLIRLIANALIADAGVIKYFEKELWEDEYNIRKEMSVVFDAPNFNVEMSVRKLAEEIARFEPWFDTETFLSYMKKSKYDDKKRIKVYSPGMQKKLMLMLALCRGPKLLVLDELTSGVDSKTKDEMWEMIFEYRKEHQVTILFSSHDKEERETYAGRELCLENGGLE